MKNLEQAISLANSTLKAVPDDDALREAKKYVNLALQHMQTIQSKRGRRKAEQMNPAEKWHLDLATSQLQFGTPKIAKSALIQIEKMIEEERKKSERPNDADMETILG